MEKLEHFLAWGATSLLGLLGLIVKLLFKDIYTKLDNLAQTNQQLLQLLNDIDKRLCLNEAADAQLKADVVELKLQPSKQH